MAEASRAAAARISGKVVRTPLHHNPDIDARVGLSVYFKAWHNLITPVAY